MPSLGIRADQMGRPMPYGTTPHASGVSIVEKQGQKARADRGRPSWGNKFPDCPILVLSLARIWSCSERPQCDQAARPNSQHPHHRSPSRHASYLSADPDEKCLQGRGRLESSSPSPSLQRTALSSSPPDVSQWHHINRSVQLPVSRLQRRGDHRPLRRSW